MAKEIIMPTLGLTMTEGTVEEWKKNEGDTVKKGDFLFSVSTDKLTNDIEAEEEGVLLKILVKAGEEAPCRSVIGYIGEKGEKLPDTAALPAPAKEIAPEKSSSKESDAKARAENIFVPATPYARKLAKEVGVDLGRTSLTGCRGMVTAKDVNASIAAAGPESGTVLVIGGGPGGYVAAIRAAQLGARVTLVEKAEIGGTCLNRGCMPTKAMLHSSEIYEMATSSDEIGILGVDVRIDWQKIQKHRASVVSKLTSGVKALIKANKIKLVTGDALFINSGAVRIGNEVHTAEKIIIATGSSPVIPDIPGVKENSCCIDSTACLELDHIPKSMVVIGGGVIGLELGTVYRRYGTKVTVIEAQKKLLPLMDGELTDLLQAKLEREGMKILTDSSVLSVENSDVGARVRVKCTESETTIDAEKVMVCVGRSSNTAGLGLEAAGIRMENGSIKVNDRMETNVPGIYAVGDCNGKLMLAHAAMAMGECAAENAMGGSRIFDAEMSPTCAYVGPEFAGVGFTEERAKELGISYKVGRFPTSGNGRSLVEGHTDGMLKILSGEKYGEILGVHILAPNATDLIEEAALAIRLEATIEEFKDTIHCHPTVAEAVRECALAVDKQAIHVINR